jgi:GT2 family glycosyltransferase
MTWPPPIAGADRPPDGAYDADIIILALDRAEETIAAIQSALGQRGASRHVIVIDQGSHPDILARLARAVAGRDDATLIALDRNLGVAGGRNLGAAFGHGQVIVGLDNDAVFDSPTTVARMTSALADNPRLAALGCRIVIDSTGRDDLSSWGYPVSLLPRAGKAFPTVTFVGAGHAIRRDAWNEAGGYDAHLFFCWEEYDFCLRAIALGWRVHYDGSIIIRHKISPEQRIAWSGARWFHFVRNRLYIERKWNRSWMSLTPRMVGYCVRAARNGCFSQTLPAFAAAAEMARHATRAPLPTAARAYLREADAKQRGGPLARLRREILSALPGRVRHTTEASIRAIRSADRGPASAPATHSVSSSRFFTPSTNVSIGSDRA